MSKKRASRPRSITVYRNMGFGGKPRKRSRRKARYMGFEGKRRKRSRRAYFLGADGGRGSILGNLTDLGITLAGAIGGSFIARQIPLPLTVKPFIPIAAGLALTMLGRQKLLKQLGAGMMVAGGLSVIRQYIPMVPVLSGEPTIMIPVREDGTPLLGAPSQFGEEMQNMVHVTGANM